MESHIVFAHIIIFLNLNVPIPYQQSGVRVRHLGAGSCIVLPASCVFSPASPQIFFSVGRPGGGVGAVGIYSMHVWR